MDLVARGRHHFTTDEAVAAIGGSLPAVRAQLRRLKAAGRIATPMRSFHVVVPPEYRRLGCLPAEQFIDALMSVLQEPYCVGLLSAVERHGVAHQRPQALQVMVRRNRPAITCGEVRVHFVARHDLERQPVTLMNTPRGAVRYATPEVTALDLVGHPDRAGGVDNVATVIDELAEVMDPARLVAAAGLAPVAWSSAWGSSSSGQGAAVSALEAVRQRRRGGRGVIRATSSPSGGRAPPGYRTHRSSRTSSSAGHSSSTSVTRASRAASRSVEAPRSTSCTWHPRPVTPRTSTWCRWPAGPSERRWIGCAVCSIPGLARRCARRSKCTHGSTSRCSGTSASDSTSTADGSPATRRSLPSPRTSCWPPSCALCSSARRAGISSTSGRRWTGVSSNPRASSSASVRTWTTAGHR